jgi:hypothetical protein
VRIVDLPPLEQVLTRHLVKQSLRYGRSDDRIPPDEHRKIRERAKMWSGHFFDDKDVAAWTKLGITDPAIAAQWASNRFVPLTTATWLGAGVREPVTAAALVAAGITVQMLQTPFKMPGKALLGGGLTLQQALERQAVTVEEIRAELERLGQLPPQQQAS